MSLRIGKVLGGVRDCGSCWFAEPPSSRISIQMCSCVYLDKASQIRIYAFCKTDHAFRIKFYFDRHSLRWIDQRKLREKRSRSLGTMFNGSYTYDFAFK